MPCLLFVFTGEELNRKRGRGKNMRFSPRRWPRRSEGKREEALLGGIEWRRVLNKFSMLSKFLAMLISRYEPLTIKYRKELIVSTKVWNWGNDLRLRNGGLFLQHSRIWLKNIIVFILLIVFCVIVSLVRVLGSCVVSANWLKRRLSSRWEKPEKWAVPRGPPLIIAREFLNCYYGATRKRGWMGGLACWLAGKTLCLVLCEVVGWQSGLTRRTRNAVGEKSPRRFESSTHRQITKFEGFWVGMDNFVGIWERLL